MCFHARDNDAMGFWTWITDRLTERPSSTKSTAGAPPRGSASPSATVTLERRAAPSRPIEVENPWWVIPGATLTEPVEPERPELSAELVGLENLLVSYFDGHDLTLPPLMRGAERALGMLGSKDCSLAAVSEAIGEDQILAAAVIRTANSPFYRGVHQFTSVPPAVTRLGIKAVRSLLFHESMKAATFHAGAQDRQLARCLWECSVASAHTMRRLAPCVGMDEEDAFLMGLLHDIGCIVTLRIIANYRNVCREQITDEAFAHLCHVSHQEFGELLANEWKLPEELTALIAGHHHDPEADDPLGKQRLMLQTTSMIASLLGYALPRPYDLLNAHQVKELKLPAFAGWPEVLEGLPEEIQEAVSHR